jgi:hypothetical protein
MQVEVGFFGLSGLCLANAIDGGSSGSSVCGQQLAFHLRHSIQEASPAGQTIRKSIIIVVQTCCSIRK